MLIMLNSCELTQATGKLSRQQAGKTLCQSEHMCVASVSPKGTASGTKSMGTCRRCHAGDKGPQGQTAS